MFVRVVAFVLLVALMGPRASSVELDVDSHGILNHTLSPILPKVATPVLKDSNTSVPMMPRIVGPPCQLPLATVFVPAGGSVTFSSPIFFSPVLCGWQFTTVAGSTFYLQCPTFNLNEADSLNVVENTNSLPTSQPYTGQSFPPYVALNAPNVVVFFWHSLLGSGGSFSCSITASSTTISTTRVPPPNTCRCGIVNRTPRIMGGGNAQVNEYPWQVGLMNAGTRNVFCGGSIISNRYIVTSAYCTKDRPISSFRILLGGHTKGSPSAGERIVSPIRTIIHPQYQLGNGFNNDISIIEIAPLYFTDPYEVLRPICLPDYPDTYAGVTATVTGWGSLYAGGPQPDILQEVNLSVVTNAFCTSVFGSYITSSMICAGTAAGGKDTCQGDSGGPLIAPDGANYELIGIVSFGSGCGIPNVPGGYARVTALQSWIQSTISGSTTCGR